MKIQRAIRALAAMQGVKMVAIAERAGMSKQMLYQVSESSKVLTVERVADALDVECSYLIGLAEDADTADPSETP